MHRLLFVTVMVFFIVVVASCGRSRSTDEEAVDIDATVNARLTEVANAEAANATPVPPTVDPADASSLADAASACTVQTNALNLRQGPGTIFPVVTILAQGVLLEPTAISPNGSFILVNVADGNGEVGWVSTDSNFVACAVALTALPVDAGPPTPTETPTPLTPSTPTPTPTAVALVVLPRAGGGDGDLTGDVFAFPELFTGSPDRPVFAEELFLQVIVFDRKATSDSVDGAGIRYVDILVTDSDETGQAGDRIFYQNRDETASFCSFGGDGPCDILSLAQGASWPGTGIPIESGYYSLTFDVVPEREDSEGGTWRIFFIVLRPGDSLPIAEDPQPEPLIAQIPKVATEQGLVFRVVAYDPTIGFNDGDGIEYVIHRIYDERNSLLVERQENNAAYCAFGGDGPCTIWDFDANGKQWPDGSDLEEDGSYRLSAEVFALDGRRITIEQSWDSAYGQDELDENKDANDSQLKAEIVEVVRGNELVFQVLATDFTVGSNNGDGVEKVEFAIFESNGAEVYAKVESQAAYCAFGGDLPCPGWNIRESGGRWPSGERVAGGAHRLIAKVYGINGGVISLETTLQIEP